jgi:ABC-type multidrug transport system permease subunit
MEPETSQQPQQSSNGYGKRPIWHWAVLYVIAAVVVYGLVYWFFMRDDGTAGTSIY